MLQHHPPCKALSPCVTKQVTFGRSFVTQQMTRQKVLHEFQFCNFPTSVSIFTKSTTNSEGPVSKHRTNTDASRGSGSMMQGTEVQNKCAGNEVVRTDQTCISRYQRDTLWISWNIGCKLVLSGSAKMPSPRFAQVREDSNLGSYINFHRNPRRIRAFCSPPLLVSRRGQTDASDLWRAPS